MIMMTRMNTYVSSKATYRMYTRIYIFQSYMGRSGHQILNDETNSVDLDITIFMTYNTEFN